MKFLSQLAGLSDAKILGIFQKSQPSWNLLIQHIYFSSSHWKSTFEYVLVQSNYEATIPRRGATGYEAGCYCTLNINVQCLKNFLCEF